MIVTVARQYGVSRINSGFFAKRVKSLRWERLPQSHEGTKAHKERFKEKMIWFKDNRQDAKDAIKYYHKDTEAQRFTKEF